MSRRTSLASRRRRLAVGLTALFFVGGCSRGSGGGGAPDDRIDPDPGPYADLQADLELNRDLWEALDIVSYEFDFVWSCFCVPELLEPVTIHVEDGALVGATYVDSGDPVPQESLEYYRTIDGLFDFIQEAIDTDAYSIVVTFDSTDGFPTDIAVDYVGDLVDDELSCTASSLLLR